MWEKGKKIREEKKLFENAVISAILAWIVTYMLLGHPRESFALEYTVQQSFGTTILAVFGLFAVFFAIGIYNRKVQHILLLPVIFAAGFLSMFLVNSPWIAAGFCLVTVLAFVYVQEDVFYYLQKITLTDQLLKITFVLLGIFLLTYIGTTTTLRYATFTASDADLGIFTQMYEYMKNTGIQNTTVERNMLMSHFEVHISPVFYLLLPVYALFSHPITLQIAQAVLVALAVWPLYLLCKRYQLTNKLTLAIGICYTLYPALSGSCFNDFHENCFLPFFLFFLLYAIEAKKNGLFVLFTVLSLSVKEDTAVLLIILALFLLISKKDRKRGGILLGISSLYFLLVMSLLSRHGQGVLGYMGNLYLDEQGGALQVLKTIIMNPGYTLRQCFDVPEKIEYMLWTLLPFSIGLVVQKKYSRYLLLIPYILFNLIPDYAPVTSIYNQYHFAVTVFLLYLVIMNISEWDAKKQRSFAVAAFLIVITLFSSSVLQRSIYQAKTYFEEREQFAYIEEILQEIPKEASVCTTSKFSPHLAKREELYGVYEGNADYTIVNLREDFYTDVEEVRAIVTALGYEEIQYEEGLLIIFERK